jgi:hypothetical protein
MSKVYESLKEVMQETLQQSNVNSNPLARVKGTNALTLNNEMEELERVVVDSIARWKTAVTEGEAAVAGETQHAERVIRTLTANTTVLEDKLRQTEEIVRGKDLAIKVLEQKLTGKIQDLESQVRSKETLLVDRDKQIDDLNSQLQVLTKGIKAMSSIFRQAEALATLETQDIGTVLQYGQANNEQENTNTSQIEGPQVMSNKADTPQETLSPDFFDRVTDQLTQVIGPMASMILRDHVKALGESMEKFPKTRVTELLKTLSEEMEDQNVKNSFCERLG